jgi:hypothetical protein
MLHLSRRDPAPTSLAIAVADTPACRSRRAPLVRIPGRYDEHREARGDGRRWWPPCRHPAGAPHTTNTHRIFWTPPVQLQHTTGHAFTRTLRTPSALHYCTHIAYCMAARDSFPRVQKLLVSRWLRVSSDIADIYARYFAFDLICTIRTKIINATHTVHRQTK